jgi:formylglycine-generating enzyme required for sulfatase activity
MAKQEFCGIGRKGLLFPLLLLAFIVEMACSENGADEIGANLIFVEGGTFTMGDVFGDGAENERPVHEVTLNDFYLSKFEVTVAQFSTFVSETAYVTSAESPDDPEERMKIMELFSGELTEKEMLELHKRFLQYAGAGYWDAEKREWSGYNPVTNWKNPGIEQSHDHPVLAISPVDAMHYCNWLSRKAGLPVAYDLKSGGILDKDGNPANDVTVVRGYRLPTEAEWEYAAREGGRKVRFGNGKNIASSSQINFRGDEGAYEYFLPGEYLGSTRPVGSYPPNSLGLYDMSGNAWEWISDGYSEYTEESLINPYIAAGSRRILRGGRWGGDAFVARAFHRSSWPGNDRCNNSGFRIARSAY